MKSVVLVRHAKSSWDNSQQKDFDRPLNERGHRDAPVMARRLKEKLPAVDLFISSPANRALTTARYFAEVYEAEVIQKPELYHAQPPVFYDVIASVDNRYDTIVLFSHNGGITDFVNGLTGTKVDNMPTCGVYAVQADIDNWADFFGAEKRFRFFDYPKNG